MAQTTQTLRVILIPLLGDDSIVQHLFTLPSLTNAASNGWFTQLYAIPAIFGIQTPPAAMALQKGLRIELLTTSTNDANLVATSLPALQSDLHLTSPMVTWSEVVTGGY